MSEGCPEEGCFYDPLFGSVLGFGWLCLCLCVIHLSGALVHVSDAYRIDEFSE